MDLDVDTAFAELGLTPAASEREIKAAWRRLVSQWHPDRNDSSAAVAKMQRINRAVEAIRLAGMRGPSAAAGPAGAPGRPAPAAPPAAAASERDGSPQPESATPQAPPRTINRRVRLTLEEAASGCTKVLQGKLTDPCAVCEGTGHRVVAAQCTACSGTGSVRERSWFGWAGPDTPCAACQGSGATKPPCTACAGSGKAPSQRYQLTVRFPAGVRDGDQLSVEARLGPPGAPSGVLNIRVEVLAHEWLTLEHDGTVRCHLPVDGFAWIANRAIEVPTLAGLHRVQLHREQLSYRLKGQGFPAQRRGTPGDQVVTVTPIFPPHMSTDQQILLDQLIATTSGPEARALDPRLKAWHQALQARKRRSPG